MSTSDPSTSQEPHSQEWWEHVLPPGQLAERLRKAQRSSIAFRPRKNPALANATPSERSAWKRLSGLPTQKSHTTRSESLTATCSRRSSFQGSTATLPRSAFKSSYLAQDASSALHFDNVSQSNSSAEVSSDEYGGATSTGHHSPERHVRYAFPIGLPTSLTQHDGSRRHGPHTTSNSPEMASSSMLYSSTWPILPSAFDPSPSASRSAGGRRMRVMSEDGMASQHSSSSTYRLPSSHSAMHLSQFNTANTDTSNWSNIAADRARAKFTHHSLPDTPELSSDEANDVTSFTTSTTTTRRIRKMNTTIRSSWKAPSPPTILRSHFDRPDQPPCPLDAQGQQASRSTSPTRRDRRVSFEQATEIPRRASVHDYTQPMAAATSQSAFDLSNLPNREYTSPFDTLPPRSNSTRRPRQGVRISGRRTTSFSLPASRRGSIRGESPFASSSSTPFSETQGYRRSSSISDAVILESLNVAHKQLASAGNLALTLTRQLSAPLRPVFHMTLFLSISSITVLSLACFLCASYMLTVWDDVSKQSHKVGEVAGKTKHKFERTLDWGLRMLGSQETGVRASSKPSSPPSSIKGETTWVPSQDSKEATTKGPIAAVGHVVFWPARMVWSATSSVAYRVTPPAVSKLFESNPSCSQKQKSGSSLPPRPPLSTLLPSIFFTLILAIGAGLSSFLASRKPAANNGPGTGMGGYTVPSTPTGMEYVHLASSSPFVGRRMPTTTAEGVKKRNNNVFC